MIKNAPTEDKNKDMNIALRPFALILLKLTEYSAESDVHSLFLFLKITIDTSEPIIPKE